RAVRFGLEGGAVLPRMTLITLAWFLLVGVSWLSATLNPPHQADLRAARLRAITSTRPSASRAGLRVELCSLRRQGDRLAVTFAFQWLDPPENRHFGFMRLWGLLDVVFWDRRGALVAEDRM